MEDISIKSYMKHTTYWYHYIQLFSGTTLLYVYVTNLKLLIGTT